MIYRVDNRLIEILREMGVSGLSLETFRSAYAARRQEREKDPKLAARRRLEQKVNDMMSGSFNED